MILLDGKKLSLELKDAMKAQMPSLEAKYGRKPCLAVIIVGCNPASQSYVKGKVKACEYVGMTSRLIELPQETEEKMLLGLIEGLNNDEEVDGILVQLPLPAHISEERVIEAIAREKDADGFHPENVANLWLGKPCTVPCTPKGIMEIIKLSGVNPAGKTAVVVGRSNIVGKPVAKLLLDANATVIMAHSKTADLASITRQADILVVAVGRADTVNGSMIKDGAVVIDVGVNRMPDGHLRGDVDFESASAVAGAITPVPGGVGPMTITMLMANTIECFISRMEAGK